MHLRLIVVEADGVTPDFRAAFPKGPAKRKKQEKKQRKKEKEKTPQKKEKEIKENK